MALAKPILNSNEIDAATASRTEVVPGWDAIATIEDLRQIARKRVPKTFFEPVWRSRE